MSILREQDVDLHEEDGVTHIDPGNDRNLKMRMKRHLDRHARQKAPELGYVRRELTIARTQEMEARQHTAYIREWAIKVAKEHIAQGASQEAVAQGLGIHPRTLQDWLEHGVALRRNK